MDTFRHLGEGTYSSESCSFSTFGPFNFVKLLPRLLLSDHIKNCCNRTRELMEWLIRLENRSFTLHELYYADYRDKFMAHFRGWRQKDKGGSFFQTVYNSGRGEDPDPIRKAIS